MPLSREASKNILNRIVDELLDSLEGGPVCQAFVKNGVVVIEDLLSLDKHKIQSLDYVQKSEKGAAARSLTKGLQRRVFLFLAWHEELVKAHGGEPLNEEDWSRVSEEDFDDFRIRNGSRIASTFNSATVSHTKGVGTLRKPSALYVKRTVAGDLAHCQMLCSEQGIEGVYG